jgi:hypothetical protein
LERLGLGVETRRRARPGLIDVSLDAYAAGVGAGRTAQVGTRVRAVRDFAASVDWIALGKARAFARNVAVGIVDSPISDLVLRPILCYMFNIEQIKQNLQP